MIAMVFREPNFTCTVTDLQGHVEEQLHHAATREDLEARLQERVQRGEIASFSGVGPYDFAKWKAKADAETRKVIDARAAGEDYEFDSRIWGLLKDHLRQMFHGKCAYCEAYFDNVAFGDVEHFRPKGKVTDDEGKAVLLPGGQTPHPGYYWLAYCAQNYLPSCGRCNTQGKGNAFPIEGDRACNPGDDLDAEGPLLLNPYADKPEEHLRFVPGVGTVAPAEVHPGQPSKRGEATVKICRLNRPGLVTDRARQQRDARQRAKYILTQADGARRFTEEMNTLKTGEPEYSAAVASEIAWVLQEKCTELAGIMSLFRLVPGTG